MQPQEKTKRDKRRTDTTEEQGKEDKMRCQWRSRAVDAKRWVQRRGVQSSRVERIGGEMGT